MSSDFDEILNAAKGKQKPAEPPKQEGKSKPPSPKRSPWADLESPEKEATIRLNVDIPISLNDRLAERARRLRKPKTELVRRLLEWALDESNE